MIPVFDDWQSVPAEWTGGAVALGNFDGVHRGHQALLAIAAEQARTLDAPLMALTFEPHPRRFFVPDTGPFGRHRLPVVEGGDHLSPRFRPRRGAARG